VNIPSLTLAYVSVSCLPGSRVEASNTCFAVDGGLRIYFDGECNDEGISETMADIRDVINSGDFDRLDPRIVNVIYLDISDINLNEEIRTKGTPEQSNTRVPGYAIILLTVVSLGLVLSVVLFLGQRMRPHDKNGFDTIPDDEGEGDF